PPAVVRADPPDLRGLGLRHGLPGQADQARLRYAAARQARPVVLGWPPFFIPTGARPCPNLISPPTKAVSATASAASWATRSVTILRPACSWKPSSPACATPSRVRPVASLRA